MDICVMLFVFVWTSRMCRIVMVPRVTFGGNAASLVGHEALRVLGEHSLVWQSDGRENAL